MSSTNLLDLSPAEMEALAESLGAQRYRGRQLAQWIFAKSVTDLDAMTDLQMSDETALTSREDIVTQFRRPADSDTGAVGPDRQGRGSPTRC